MHIEHHHARLSETALHYVSAGTGDAVVLVHGWPSTWYEWRHVIPLIGAVVAIGGYVLANYMAVTQALELSVADLRQLAKNSIEASWMDAPAKAGWQAAIDQLQAPD